MKDQLIFPEIDYNKVEKTKGMNISDHDHGEDRRRRSGAAAADGHAVPAVTKEVILMATTAKIAKEVTKLAELERATKTASSRSFRTPPAQPL